MEVVLRGGYPPPVPSAAVHWNVIDQDRWDKIPFASIKMSDVRRYLSYGKGSGRDATQSPEAVEEIKKILLGIS